MATTKPSKTVAGPPRSKETVDLAAAQAAVDEAVNLADSDATTDTDRSWDDLVQRMSDEAERLGVRSYIAALGTALVAKAANRRIDVFSLKAADDSPGAHDARRPAEKILVPASKKYRFSLGVPGRQPLNNQPFFRHQRIAASMRVRSHARPLLLSLIQALHEAQQLTESEATRALASFIRIRRKFVAKYASRAQVPMIDNVSALRRAVSALLERSEGGRLAQAAVAGLFDAAFADGSVRVASTNDPDRQFPGDVFVSSNRVSEQPRAYEVRHKPVEEHDVLAFADKLASFGCKRGGVVALSAKQSTLIAQLPSDMDVSIETLYGTDALIDTLFFRSTATEQEFVLTAVGAVRQRLIDQGCSAESVLGWDKTTSRA